MIYFIIIFSILIIFINIIKLLLTRNEKHINIITSRLDMFVIIFLSIQIIVLSIKN